MYWIPTLTFLEVRNVNQSASMVSSGEADRQMPFHSVITGPLLNVNLCDKI